MPYNSAWRPTCSTRSRWTWRRARGGRSTRDRSRWPTRSWSTRSPSGSARTRWPPAGEAVRCPGARGGPEGRHRGPLGPADAARPRAGRRDTQEYKGCVAMLVEIDATDRAAPRVTKAVVAVDVGRQSTRAASSPDDRRGGGRDLGTLRAGNHIDNGAVRESSFTDFKWARMRHSPLEMEVHVMPPSTGKPGGAGELGFPPPRPPWPTPTPGPPAPVPAASRS